MFMNYKFMLALLATVVMCKAGAQTLDLSNEWTYTLGAKTPLDQAKPSEKPMPWVQKDTMLRKTGLAIFRRKLVVPSALKAQWKQTGVAALYLGRIQQADETFFNGVSLGKTPSSDVQRVYIVPAKLINWDGENNIEIRVEHWGQQSGASALPFLAEAKPEHVFSMRNKADEAVRKNPATSQTTRYVELKSVLDKELEGRVEAAYYNNKNVLLHREEKVVTLKNGLNTVPFTFTSPSSFLKVVYTLNVPAYNLQRTWNELSGYESVVYKSTSPKVRYSVPLKFEAASPEGQKMGGWVGDRFLINMEKRLKQVDEAALLEGYVNKPGKHAWIGEHVGKFLEATCYTYRSTGDKDLKIQIDRTAQQLIAAQKEDGYLGTYTTDNEWTSWDVWSHKYNLVGLLSYYELSGFAPALSAAKKIGDLLVGKFGKEEGKRNIIKAGAHVGMAATSVIDPVTDLYQFTGDKRYLDFCYYVVDSYNVKDGPQILKTLNATGRVDKTANAKAYEMMSNLVGLVKLYKLTGDTTVLKPVLTAWDDIRNNRLYITGTTSSFEHFQDDHLLPATDKDNMGEGCVTTTWIQYNYQLLTIFGDMKYVDELERAVYNHLAGAENPQNGCVSYYTPLQGKKPYGCNITCCMSSVPRGIAMIPLFANGKLNGSPLFSFYQPGTFATTVKGKNGKAQGVSFQTITDFLQKGDVNIVVGSASATPYKMLLRKPWWAADFSVSVNGAPVSVGNNNLVSVNRTWKKGDRVTIKFDMPVTVLDGGISYPGMIALQRGPQVLAFDKAINKAEATAVQLVASNLVLQEAAMSLPKNWIGKQGYVVPNAAGGENILLVPYADASQTGGIVATWLKKKE
jgi:DUF1680 family protein